MELEQVATQREQGAVGAETAGQQDLRLRETGLRLILLDDGGERGVPSRPWFHLARPTLTLSVGENGRASQPVGVNDGALPWVEWPEYDTASKVTVFGVHEVGLRMKPWPLAVPMRVRSSDVMSVVRPLAFCGKSLTIVSRPKSLRRSWTPDCWMIFVPADEPSQRAQHDPEAGRLSRAEG